MYIGLRQSDPKNDASWSGCVGEDFRSLGLVSLPRGIAECQILGKFPSSWVKADDRFRIVCRCHASGDLAVQLPVTQFRDNMDSFEVYKYSKDHCKIVSWLHFKCDQTLPYPMLHENLH